MRNSYSFALLSIALLISGCSLTSFDDHFFDQSDNNGRVFPPPPQESWETAFRRHQEAVKKLQPDPLERYIITDDNELLLINPIAFDATINRDKPFTFYKIDSVKHKNLYFTFQYNGGPWPVVIAEGKVFFNRRRIYDIKLLQSLISESAINIKSFVLEAARVSVTPNEDDLELLDWFHDNLDNPLLEDLIKKRKAEKWFNPVDISDHSQRQSFNDVRTSTNAVGQINIDGHVSELPLPMFVTFDSLPSDTYSKLTSVAFKMGSHYFGTVVAASFDKTPLSPKHYESSAVYGFSVNNAFIEGQIGSFNDTSKEFASLNGQRYQLTVGYDAGHITPFVRVLNRSANADSLTQFGAGLETSVSELKLGDVMLDTKGSLSYLGNTSGYITGYLSSTFKATFSDGTALGISNDYDSINGMYVSINFSFNR